MTKIIILCYIRVICLISHSANWSSDRNDSQQQQQKVKEGTVVEILLKIFFGGKGWLPFSTVVLP